VCRCHELAQCRVVKKSWRLSVRPSVFSLHASFGARRGRGNFKEEKSMLSVAEMLFRGALVSTSIGFIVSFVVDIDNAEITKTPNTSE